MVIILILYFIIALLATTLGSMTGMGGGIIIKPILDVLGHFDIESINMLSTITVFAMSLASITKQIHQKVVIPLNFVIPLALGSAIGGNIGQVLFNWMKSHLSNVRYIPIIQNVILALIIVVICIYMQNKSKIKCLTLKGIISCLAVGLFLGIISSFLGIGGGPMNVPLLIFVFSFDTKTAILCSIITILFSQLSKILLVTITEGFSSLNLSMIVPMCIGAVLGGIVGAKFSANFSEKTIEKMFNGVLSFVFVICIFNIVKNLL